LALFRYGGPHGVPRIGRAPTLARPMSSPNDRVRRLAHARHARHARHSRRSRRSGPLSLAAAAPVVACTSVQACSGDAPPPGAGPDASTADGSDPTGADAAPPGDGGSSGDGAQPDAGPACDPNKPFGTPVELSELSIGTSHGGARMTPDMKTIFFHVGMDGG